MSTHLVKVDNRTVPSHAETMEVAEVLAQSGAFPTVEKAAQAYAVIIIGQSFGMAPGEALMAISLVQGKPSFDVHWQAKRIIELGHHYDIVELDGQKCRIMAFRRVAGALTRCGEVTMTMDRAKQIRINDRQQQKDNEKTPSTLGGKWNYRSWAEDMLYAYCMRRVVRRYFPEVLGGYAGADDTTLDEMADDGVVEGEVTTLEENAADLFGDTPNESETTSRGDILNAIVAEQKGHMFKPAAMQKWLKDNDIDALSNEGDVKLLAILDHLRMYGERSLDVELGAADDDDASERDPETGEPIPPGVGVQAEMGLNADPNEAQQRARRAH